MIRIINYAALWGKVGEYARRAGRVGARPVLLLYYVMKSPHTPKSDKLLIFSTLSYLVLPIDLIDAKRLPIIGWIDEVVSLSGVGVSVSVSLPEPSSVVMNSLRSSCDDARVRFPCRVPPAMT